MITVLVIMVAGFVVGYLLRNKKKVVKALNKSTLWIIFILLFFMGVSVGTNPQIMENIDTIGYRGVQFAFVAILGSVLVTWVVYKLFFKRGIHER